VGKAKAKELLLTGERVYADEALRLGLVNKVVPFEQLRDVTLGLATKIANGHRNAVQLTRFAVDVSEVQSLRDSLDLASVCNSMTTETVIKVMAMDREYKKTKLDGL
jgi:enoyl-CoA hydratase/carnithine racemase